MLGTIEYIQQDPANLGSLMRISAAVDISRLWITGVCTLKTQTWYTETQGQTPDDSHATTTAGNLCVDPHCPKVVRASSGQWYQRRAMSIVAGP